MTWMDLAEGACFSMTWCFSSENEKGGHVSLRWFDRSMQRRLWLPSIRIPEVMVHCSLRELGSRIRDFGVLNV